MPTTSFAISDVGLRRSHNEDSYVANDALKIYLVADGMGGHAAGEVASQTAARIVEDFVRNAEHDRDMTWPFRPKDSLSLTENTLLSAVKLANQIICRMAGERPEMSGMGTTIAGVKVDDQEASIFHVGDSRVYRLRDGVMAQLTTDHSWVNEQLQRQMITEEEARTHRWKNVITRALGNKTTIEVDLQTTDLKDGDLLVICTDGLSGVVSDEVIYETLMAHKDDLETTGRDLVDQANAAGGHDNITVVLIKYTAAQ